MRFPLVSLVVALALLALPSCGGASPAQPATAVPPTAVPATPDPCSSEALTAFAKDARPVLDRFLRQVKLTEDLPRISIGTAMQGLADREDAIVALEAPACLSEWHERANAMAQYYREGFSSFASQQAGAELILKRAAIIRDSVMPALDTIEAGSVPELKPLTDT